MAIMHCCLNEPLYHDEQASEAHGRDFCCNCWLSDSKSLTRDDKLRPMDQPFLTVIMVSDAFLLNGLFLCRSPLAGLCSAGCMCSTLQDIVLPTLMCVLLSTSFIACGTARSSGTSVAHVGQRKKLGLRTKEVLYGKGSGSSESPAVERILHLCETFLVFCLKVDV